MKSANDNGPQWGGWALIGVAMALGTGLLIWSVVRAFAG